MRGAPRSSLRQTAETPRARPCAATALAFRAAPRQVDAARAVQRAAQPALRRPSIHPDFRERLFAAEELCAQLDTLLAARQHFEVKPRAADLGIRLRDNVAHLYLVEGNCALDFARRDVLEVLAGE